ncbi:hypothetical protein [Intrasporangium sp. YIM S08009]|uniref:hypothetical protein n=1 Tax=Intrasporangium zincisolvens TaxID=3080018 RepID=UPI002B054A97|nr:hypothetical protein [Intrasporangium sp. YIM S08009]
MSEMRVVPSATGVTVTGFTSPQLVKVTEEGETVATLVFDDLTVAENVDWPVRSQPDLPSLFVTQTSVVLPVGPPMFSGMASTVESTVASMVFAIPSASAFCAPAPIKAMAAASAASRRRADIRVPLPRRPSTIRPRGSM